VRSLAALMLLSLACRTSPTPQPLAHSCPGRALTLVGDGFVKPDPATHRDLENALAAAGHVYFDFDTYVAGDTGESSGGIARVPSGGGPVEIVTSTVGGFPDYGAGGGTLAWGSTTQSTMQAGWYNDRLNILDANGAGFVLEASHPGDEIDVRRVDPAGNVYFADGGGAGAVSLVSRWDHETHAVRVVVPAQPLPAQVNQAWIDDDHAYAVVSGASGSTIFAAPLTGGALTPIGTLPAPMIYVVGSNSTHLFFSVPGTGAGAGVEQPAAMEIRAVPKSGGAVATVASGIAANGFVVDDSALYWSVVTGEANATTQLHRLALDECNVYLVSLARVTALPKQ
jgi:hypothetical protein